MYSDKKNILQLVALLKAHGVRKIVLCPGSRNAAIVHTLANIEDFTCYSVTDERSAGFFAIGLSLQGGGPAAVCCTSGSALLNLHPAVAEAFYQQVPLIVISADRPAAWIGQMDGQTLPQPHVFGTLVKMSVNLPEVHTEEDEWFCNRLINEAILETTHHGKGPVHINVPISEPIYRFTAKTLPEVRVITRYQGLSVYDRDYKELIERLNKYNKRMVVVGQMNLIYLFEKKYVKPLYKHFAWLTEHLGNQTIPRHSYQEFRRRRLFHDTGTPGRHGPRNTDYLRRTHRIQTIEEIPAQSSPARTLACCRRREDSRFIRLPDHRHRDGSV